MLFDVYVSLLPAQRQTVRVEAGCPRAAILAALELPEVAKLLVGVGETSLIVSAFRAKVGSAERQDRAAGEGLKLSA